MNNLENLPDISQAKAGGELLSIDTTRPLEEYPTIDTCVGHILATGDTTQHIYTESINVGGKAIQERMETYLADEDHLSSSMLKEADKSPFHLYYAKESGQKEELEKLQKNKGHFELGTYLHECVLEPTKFGRVITKPEASLVSLAGAETLISFWQDKYEEEFDGIKDGAIAQFNQYLNQISEENFDIAKLNGKKRYIELLEENSAFKAVGEENRMIISIVKKNYDRYGDGILHRILKHSKREISMYATDPMTGMKVKIRPDSMAFKENIGVDAIISVKSTRQSELRRFAYDTAQMNYPLSEGMYQEVASHVTGRDVNVTLNIMLQTKAPFGVALYWYRPEDIEAGKYRYRNALNIAADCIKSGHWPAYDAYAELGNMGIIELPLPSFYRQLSDLPINLEL
jgi:hypothetical protein